jgi:hypothetical protein
MGLDFMLGFIPDLARGNYHLFQKFNIQKEILVTLAIVKL